MSRGPGHSGTQRRQTTGSTNCAYSDGEVSEIGHKSWVCDTQLLPYQVPVPQQHGSSQFASVVSRIPNSGGFRSRS